MLRVGIHTWWTTRGQGTVGRHLRSAIDALGHQTFVLARQQPPWGPREHSVDDRDVWAQPRVTVASSHTVPREELLRWAETNELDAIFFFQKYEFDDVEALRRTGITTFGCFMWERLKETEVAGAREAYDVVYSLNRCSHDRYRAWGLDSQLLGWGCHPELLEQHWAPAGDRAVRFFFPGGYLQHRKALRPLLSAFLNCAPAEARLLIKAQGRLHSWMPPGSLEEDFEDLLDDTRVRLHVEDMSVREYLSLVASSHAMLAITRWEGLGLHLYEGLGAGMPIVSCDAPPMNEVLGSAARLVHVDRAGVRPSGIPSYDPDVDDLGRAIVEVMDPTRRSKMAAAARARATELKWDRVVARLGRLLAGERLDD